MDLPELTNVKEQFRDELKNIDGINAIGVGLMTNIKGELTDELGIVIYHKDPNDSVLLKITNILGNIRREVRCGEFHAPQTEAEMKPSAEEMEITAGPREKKVNPMIGGISGSADNLTNLGDKGTIGLVVKANDGTALIMSNQHVICTKDPEVGDGVSQPAREWFGDLAAELVDWRKGNINYQGTQYGVDVAIARPTNDRTATIGQIYNLPTPIGSGTPVLNRKVAKSGITTEITNGIVDGIVDVLEPDMRNQITITGLNGVFSKPGDSGSAVIDTTENKVVALLWGGSTEKSPRTIASPINPILSLFHCSIV
jgi:hypothetical protein